MNKRTFLTEAFEHRYELPKGWWTLYQQFCIDLYKALEVSDAFKGFEILQVKEKYGRLTFYSKGATRLAEDVITKYSLLSEQVCCVCGYPATVRTYGYICPYCTEHVRGTMEHVDDAEIIELKTTFTVKRWNSTGGVEEFELDCTNEWYRYLERGGYTNEV